MSCKKLSNKARAEQDYWLSFSDIKAVNEVERMDFLRYDSHGGDLFENSILLGKKRHGQYGEVMKAGYSGIDWPGGLYVIADYLTREPFSVRPLREWFGDEAVYRWLRAFFWEAFRV